ncbi:hypothetical protein MPER_16259, partial [Moniliophthora perniciosa FA553]
KQAKELITMDCELAEEANFIGTLGRWIHD